MTKMSGTSERFFYSGSAKSEDWEGPFKNKGSLLQAARMRRPDLPGVFVTQGRKSTRDEAEATGEPWEVSDFIPCYMAFDKAYELEERMALDGLEAVTAGLRALAGFPTNERASATAAVQKALDDLAAIRRRHNVEVARDGDASA
jgi:hypothetical protein